MLRLFSNIRKSLLAENNTVKYAKYAVGEVLLIMVGILLALQVQTWNEERRLQQERRELIESLIMDFGTTLRLLDEDLERAQSNLAGFEKFLRAAVGENNAMSFDEIKERARDGFRGNFFQPSIGSYRAAQSSGALSLINDAILQELFVEFEQANKAWQSIEEISRENTFVGVRLELRKILGTENVLIQMPDRFRPKAFELTEKEYREIIADKEVYAIFSTIRSIRGFQTQNLSNLKRITEEILIALETLD